MNVYTSGRTLFLFRGSLASMSSRLGYVILIYFGFTNVCFGQELTQIVVTKSGPVRGFYQKNALSGKSFSSFLGIPYAEPPLKERRFLPPVEIKPWTDVFDAIQFGDICPQFCHNRFCGDEDCLFLNVYTPVINFTESQNSEPLKAVMVWIHGGAYVAGSGNNETYGPDYLIDQDVILVTFNYRLGVFGFMNLGHELVPGNAGLKDQNLVLKWVRKNIVRFGGDPDNVTVFGQSAGAVAVDLHNIAKMSQGLYARSIAMSGSVFCPWGFLTYEAARAKGLKFVKKCSKSPLRSIDEVVSFMQDAPVYKLITNVLGELIQLVQSSEFAFAPSVEVVQYKDNEKFIDECYLERFQKGQIHSGEHMMGFTSLESGVVSKVILNGLNKLVGEFGKNIWDFFNGEKLLKLQGVAEDLFIAPIDMKYQYMLRYGHSKAIYYYYFNYVNKISPAKGASHSEDLQYVFNQVKHPHLSAINETKASNTDLDCVTRDRLVQMLANFAKTGKPSYEEFDVKTGLTHFDWTKSTQSGGYLEISNDIIMKENVRPLSSRALKVQEQIENQFKSGLCVPDVLNKRTKTPPK